LYSLVFTSNSKKENISISELASDISLGIVDKIIVKGDNLLITYISTSTATNTVAIIKEAKKEDREKICSGSGAVILATSGMMNGGPIMDYFHRLAENSANTLVFVGYLAEGTFGRKIQQGLKTLPISDNGKTKRLDVKMRIETIDGFSGHSDFNQLVSYVASLKPKPKKIIVNHGDPMRAVEFSKYCAAKFGISSTTTPLVLSTEKFPVVKAIF
jgi:predicted metal-dependent RNase